MLCEHVRTAEVEFLLRFRAGPSRRFRAGGGYGAYWVIVAGGRAVAGVAESLSGLPNGLRVAGWGLGMEDKHTPMDKQAAARVQSKAAKQPSSASRQSGFDRRAQSAGDRNEQRGKNKGKGDR